MFHHFFHCWRIILWILSFEAVGIEWKKRYVECSPSSYYVVLIYRLFERKVTLLNQDELLNCGWLCGQCGFATAKFRSNIQMENDLYNPSYDLSRFVLYSNKSEWGSWAHIKKPRHQSQGKLTAQLLHISKNNDNAPRTYTLWPILSLLVSITETV